MPSLLEQLGNEQALLMYLAQELGPEDRGELEQMLLANPAMKAELESLRETQHKILSAMAVMDRSQPLPLSRQAAVRGVRRCLNLQQLVPALHESSTAAGTTQKSLRYPWWSYPLATAAAIVLAFLVWWGNSSYAPHSYNEPNQVAWEQDDRTVGPGVWNPMQVGMDAQVRQAYFQARQQRLAEWLQDSFSGDDYQTASADHPLAKAEAQLASLSEPNTESFFLSPAAPTNQ